MAVLKALTRTQMKILGAEMAKAVERQQVTRKPLLNMDAHVQAYRDYLVSTFTGKVRVLKTGKPLRAAHHWQADYRSATPRGMVLVAPRLNGIQGRFATK